MTLAAPVLPSTLNYRQTSRTRSTARSFGPHRPRARGRPTCWHRNPNSTADCRRHTGPTSVVFPDGTLMESDPIRTTVAELAVMPQGVARVDWLPAGEGSSGWFPTPSRAHARGKTLDLSADIARAPAPEPARTRRRGQRPGKTFGWRCPLRPTGADMSRRSRKHRCQGPGGRGEAVPQ